MILCVPVIIVVLCLLLTQEQRERQSEAKSPLASSPQPTEEREAASKTSARSGRSELEERGKTAVMFKAPATDQPDPAALPERQIIASNWKADADPALANFARWTEKFVNASAGAKAALEQDGIAAADARLAALEKQIQSDPRRALSNAIPQALCEQLPESVQSRLETRVDGIGDVGRVCEFAKQGAAPIPEYDYAVVDGTKYEAYRYGPGSSLRFIDDSSIHGIAVNGKLAVLDSPFRALEPGEAASGKTINLDQTAYAREGAATAGVQALFGGSTAVTASNTASLQAAESELVMAQSQMEKTYRWQDDPNAQLLSNDSHAGGHVSQFGRPALSHTTGQKTVLVVRVQIAGYAQMTGNLLDDNFMATRGQDFNNRMLLDSWNKTSLAFTISPIIYLDSMPSDWMGTALAKAQELYGYNPSSYNARVAIRNDPGWGAAGVHFGSGEIILNNNFDASVFMHEFGHYLGLPHARKFWSSTGNPMDPAHDTIDYGDDACWMSAHFNDWPTRTYIQTYLNRLGWLPDNLIQSVSRSGTYTIYQYDGAISLTDTSKPRSLKISRDSKYNFWLSIQGNNPETPGQDLMVNGVVIRADEGPYNPDSNFLALGTPHGESIVPGDSWYDSAADITITTLSVSGTNPNRQATVQVTFGPNYTGNHDALVSGGIYRFAPAGNTGISIAAPTSTASGQSIVMSASSDTDALQKWVAWRNSDGTFSFNRQGTSLWLNVSGNSYADHANVTQATGNSTDAQRFFVNVTATGQIYLAHKAPNSSTSSDKVVDVDFGVGNDLQQYQFVGASGQQWNAEMLGIAANQNYRFLCQLGQGQAVDLDGASPTNGARVQLWNWNAATQQQWKMLTQANGNLKFQSVRHTSKVLDVDTASSKVQAWDSLSGANQRWSLSRVTGQWVRVIPEYNTTLSLQSTSSANGTQLTVGPNTGSPGQVWRFANPN